jgi:hypothetical protein
MLALNNQSVRADGSVRKQLAQLAAMTIRNAFVSIEIQNPLAAAFAKRIVARLRKISRPCEIKNLGTKVSGNLFCPVSRAGVNDNDLVNDTCNALKTSLEELLLVLDNHAERKPWSTCP